MTECLELCDEHCGEKFESLIEYNDRLVRYAHGLALALAEARDERNALSEAM